MKSKISIKLIALLLLVNATLFAQMNYYAMPPQKLIVSGGFVPGALYSGAPSSDAYQVSNGAYSPTGQLLFFVKNDGVYNAAGGYVGQLAGDYGTSSAHCSDHSQYLQITGEVAIVPIPGSCTDYYVIYTKTDHLAGDGYAFYAKVSCSGGTVTVTNFSGPTFFTCGTKGDVGGIFNAYVYKGFIIGAGGRIAVSKIASGSGATSKRYLYIASTVNGITKYEITNTGITNVYSFPAISGISTSDYAGYELELSPDQKWLAFSNHNYVTAGTKVFIVELSTSTGNYAGTPPKIITAANAASAIKGLEFDKTTLYPNLYVAGGTTAINVLAKIDVNTLTPTLITAGANDFSNTFLELAKNGYIMAITPGTGSVKRLSKIHPTTNAITSQNLTSNSSHTYAQMGNVYTLPDQVDGEDYTTFIGQQYVALTGITINNVLLNGDCDQGFPYPKLYNCAAINLNATYYNNISTGSEYKIDITASSCGQAVTGAGLLNYTSGWISGTVPANYDIRSLTDVNGYKLQTATGQHLVTVSVKDACGNITTKSNSFNVLSEVTPSPNLEIYKYVSPLVTYVPASIYITTPVQVGAISIGIRINGSTGSITAYNITIDEVSSLGATIAANIYNTTYTTADITMVPPINLNSLCIAPGFWASPPPSGPGSPECTPYGSNVYSAFFAYNSAANSLNKYYRITVNFSNPCSSASAYSYVKVINAFNKTINPNTDLSSEIKTDVLVYPNPANNLVNFNLNNEVDDVYTIELFDVLGKKMATITDNKALNKGDNTLEFNTSALPNGTYTYKVSSNTINKTGLLNIVK
jgi:hypothetical protein